LQRIASECKEKTGIVKLSLLLFIWRHRRRRDEGWPLLVEKFSHNLATRFDADQCGQIQAAFADETSLDSMSVDGFVDLFI